MNHRQCIQSLLVAAAILLGGLVSPRTAAAQETLSLSVVLADSPYFPTNRWLPMRVLAMNRTAEDVTGQVVFPFVGANEKVTFRLPLTVQAKSSLTTIVYIYVPVPPEPSGNRKSTEVPPICTAEWRSAAGAMVSRCPVLAQPLVDDPDGGMNRIRLDRPFVMNFSTSTDGPSPLPEAVVDPTIFIEMFQAASGARLLNVPADAGDAPRDLLGYDPAAIVTLDGPSLAKFDAAQQQALIDFMTTGGVVVLADPFDGIDPADTWIGPYLPARRIGTHYADSIAVQSGDKSSKLKLVAPIDLCEWAVDSSIAGAQVVAAEPHYVHAAYKRVGLGRLIVTSFPLAGLDVKDAAVQKLWADLFPSAPSLRWEDSQLAGMQSQLLESMVGLKVPPWIVAATVVGAYVLLVLLIQLVARQGWRPTGFATAVALSILIAAGLVVFSLFRDRTVNLSMARIDVIDLDHGGVRNEAASLLGPETDKFPIGVVPGASLRQASSDEAKKLDLMIAPFKAEDAGVYPRRIDRVWQSASAVPTDQTLHAVGQFDENGLAIRVENTLGAINSPLVLGPNGRFNLQNLPAAQSTARADDGDLHRSAIQLDSEQLRARILNAATTSTVVARQTASPLPEGSIHLAGWLADAPPSLLQLPGGQTPAVVNDNTLVRTPVHIEASPVGSKVHISSAFTQMMGGEVSAIPYDAGKHEWLDQFMSSDFLIGFAFPSAIGHVKTTHVQLTLGASAAQQTITLRRGQVVNGQPSQNPAGEVIATLNEMIDPNYTIGFDVSPGDVDANGWAWIMVSVDSPGGTQAHWRISQFVVSYDGVIDGPPRDPVLPKRDIPMPAPAPTGPARPAAPKKPPATKPAKKPTTKPTTKPAKKKESQPQ